MPQQATRQPIPGKGAGQAPFPMNALIVSAVASAAFTDPRTGVACLTSSPIACLGVWIKNAAYNLDGSQNKDDLVVMTRVMPPGSTATISATPVMTTNSAQVLGTLAPGAEAWFDTDDATKLVVQRSGTVGTRTDAFMTPVRGGQ
jgi:hypothetical protein